MDGPMTEKFANTNATTPDGLIDDVLRSETTISRNAHMSVCPVIGGDERSEGVEMLIKQHDSLANIFKEKIEGIESLRKMSFDDLLTRLSRQNDMQIINSIADFIGLGIPKICQVFKIFFCLENSYRILIKFLRPFFAKLLINDTIYINFIFIQLTQRGQTLTWQRGADGKIKNVENDPWVNSFRIERRFNNQRGGNRGQRGSFRGNRRRPY